MKRRIVCYWFVLFAVVLWAAPVNSAPKKQKQYFQLLEAYVQKTLPGIQGPSPQATVHFLLIWEGKKHPDSFFWRGENGWVPCNTIRAHKIINRSSHIPEGIDYTMERVLPANIEKGDTLLLTPVAAGKLSAPAEVADSIKNTLYFRTAGKQWKSYPIKNIGRKPDIAMP